MAQRISISYHDYLPYDVKWSDGPPKINLSANNAGFTPTDVLHIGDNVDIFMTRARLAELRDKISEYLDAQDAERNAQVAEPLRSIVNAISTEVPHVG